MPKSADYAEMSLDELQSAARDAGMKGYSSMRKAELVEALSQGGGQAAASGGSGSRSLSGILATLKQEHDEVKELFATFEKQADGDLAGTAGTVATILHELTRHAEMEEEIVYPALQSAQPEIYHEAHEEHHVAELLIGELSKMSPDDSYKAKVMVLAENVRHHIKEEESEAFEILRRLPQEDLEAMAQRWNTVKEKVNAAVPARRSR